MYQKKKRKKKINQTKRPDECYIYIEMQAKSVCIGIFMVKMKNEDGLYGPFAANHGRQF